MILFNKTYFKGEISMSIKLKLGRKESEMYINNKMTVPDKRAIALQRNELIEPLINLSQLPESAIVGIPIESLTLDAMDDLNSMVVLSPRANSMDYVCANGKTGAVKTPVLIGGKDGCYGMFVPLDDAVDLLVKDEYFKSKYNMCF